MRTHCRVCGTALQSVLELGDFALCGTFPMANEIVPVEPLGLSWCKWCSLVQMSYDYKHDFYGPGYGYRSSLNASMVKHLRELANEAALRVGLQASDVVLDIGGNDGTLLNSIKPLCTKLLMDPTARQIEGRQIEDVIVLPEKFTFGSYNNAVNRKAKIVFSIAMFYDLPDPVGFARQVAKALDKDGVWVFEQSYLPTMVARNAYDTICHEHVEYYSLRAIRYILNLSGLELVDVSLNDCNGGSIRVTAAHAGSCKVSLDIERMDSQFNQDVPLRFDRLFSRMEKLREDLQRVLCTNGRVVGFGASTKGNTLLQFCDITLPCIVDVNKDKWGRVTPGTNIPIVREDADANAYLVLPWHFREFIVQKEAQFLSEGGSLIFPLPDVEVFTGLNKWTSVQLTG